MLVSSQRLIFQTLNIDAMTLSITTLGIMALSIMGLVMTLSINDTQHWPVI
jgi:hypothetical protein